MVNLSLKLCHDVDIRNIVKHKLDKKESVEKDKEQKKSDNKVGENKEKENCKYFLRNQCRHGFSGKKEVDGVKECPWMHPVICM